MFAHALPLHSQIVCSLHASALSPAHVCLHVRDVASHLHVVSRLHVSCVRCAVSQRWRQTAAVAFAFQRHSALFVHVVCPPMSAQFSSHTLRCASHMHSTSLMHAPAVSCWMLHRISHWSLRHMHMLSRTHASFAWSAV